jgi:diadenosine tetraphosphate (Ap4A) HIT family hydrolase
MGSASCPFCLLKDDDIVVKNKMCYACRDRYPVTEGHMLVIPFRHVRDLFGLTDDEWYATFALVDECRRLIESEYSPDGYNIGFNVGRYAGQSVMHCHCHVIPRYVGDVENPTGGIRAVIPHKRLY